MRVLLVGNYLADGQESMQRFAAMLAEGLMGAGCACDLVRPEPFFGRLASGPRGAGKWFGYLDKFLRFPQKLRRMAAGYDLAHVCDHSNAPVARALRGVPHLVTCHDLLAVRAAMGEFPQHRVRASGRALQRMILGALRRVPEIAADSEATRRDVARLVGRVEREVPVVHPGVNRAYRPVPGSRVEEPGYMLSVGGDAWYKNREGLAAIHGILRERLGERAPELVVVGPPLRGAREGVRAMGNVTDENLRSLYAGARLLLFPSHAEGYGWPVLEGMACGCPVVATGRAPMTELGGEAAVYFADPENHAEAAEVVLGLLAESPEVRGRRVAAGLARVGMFGVDRMVEGYLAIYRRMLERRTRGGDGDA